MIRKTFAKASFGIGGKWKLDKAGKTSAKSKLPPRSGKLPCTIKSGRFLNKFFNFQLTLNLYITGILDPEDVCDRSASFDAKHVEEYRFQLVEEQRKSERYRL